ncbi:TPA: hypothetical protein N0F65_001726 [Lagenidium giganteum]|uniref:Uncharacterized protein n=1 Tax=Lagenidium giganteum TaxID=4803 RepID=A0AAV2Z6Y7_9STRA|nr:TPA: hypothetical protein N0F65_001726 [Lagenidium giganteum]
MENVSRTGIYLSGQEREFICCMARSECENHSTISVRAPKDKTNCCNLSPRY